MTDPIPSAMYLEANKEIARQHDTIARLERENAEWRGKVITLDWQVKDLQNRINELLAEKIKLQRGFILPENWFLSRLIHQAADLYWCVVVEAKDIGGGCVEESGTTPLEAMQNAAIKAWEATK